MFGISMGVFGKIEWTPNGFTGNNPTTTDILGPFYRPNAPFRSNINPPNFKGTLLHVSGVIYKQDGRTPYKNCLIEVWQANEEGLYDNLTENFFYRGAIKTGATGKYHFISSRPAAYTVDNAKTIYRPAHIHFRIAGAGEQDLVTQIYFKEGEHLNTDQYSASPSSINRILPVTKNKQGDEAVVFDIYMQKEFTLDDAGFKAITGMYSFQKDNRAEFFRVGDLLFMKWKGQIEQSFTYKGNNTFEDISSNNQLRFELGQNGEVKAIFYYKTAANKEATDVGKKILKYD